MCKYLDSRSRSASIQQYALKSFVGSDEPFHQFLKRKTFLGSDGNKNVGSDGPFHQFLKRKNLFG